MRRVTIACSSRSLAGPQQLLAEVVVDRRVGRAAGRAGQRDRRGAQPLAAHQQLGRGARRRPRRRARRRRRSRSRSPRAAPRRPPRRRAAPARGRRPRARARSSRRRRRGSARRRARRRPRSARAAPWRRSGSDRPAPGRAAAALGRRSRARRRSTRATSSSGSVVARREHRDGQPHVAPAPRERELGHDQAAGAKPAQCGAPAPPAANGEAADGHEPGARRPVGRVGDRPARELPPGVRHRGEARAAAVVAVAPRRRGGRGVEPRDAAERGQRGAVAIGLLVAEPVVLGRPRREDDRARIDLRAHAHREPREHAGARAPGAPHRALAAQQQLRTGRAVEREPVLRGPGGGRHPHQGTARRVRRAHPGRGWVLRVRSRRGRARGRSRPCAPSRPGRTGAPCARTPRPCRACR